MCDVQRKGKLLEPEPDPPVNRMVRPSKSDFTQDPKMSCPSLLSLS